MLVASKIRVLLLCALGLWGGAAMELRLIVACSMIALLAMAAMALTVRAIYQRGMRRRDRRGLFRNNGNTDRVR